MKLSVLYLGQVDYTRAYELQRKLHDQRVQEEIPDTLLLLEHPPVFTLGKRGTKEDITWNTEQCQARGVQIVQTDRGGQVTYHGPGQLVGYLIVNLYRRDRHIRWFVGELENIFVRVLKAHWGIDAFVDEANPGVWVGKNKITAVGIAIQQKVTLHGFAFNVNPDLSYFSGIIPCGISGDGRWVTSLAQELKSPPTPSLFDTARQVVLDEFVHTYGYDEVVST